MLIGAVDGPEHAEGAVVQLVGGQVAGEVSQGPVQVAGLTALAGVFFPAASAQSWIVA
jgi:hypothetical protein